MQSGGGAYSWYINKFCQYEQNLAQKEHKSIYEILEQELTNTSVGSNGLLFYLILSVNEVLGGIQMLKLISLV